MAVSQYRTWLSLDRFFQIIGINPIWGNQMNSTTYFKNNTCGDVFFQYDFQHSDRVGRDSIALAIMQAEQEMAREAGYNLMPDWTLDERLPYPRPSHPESYNISGVNPRWQLKSVEASRGHLISGGVRLKSLLQANAAVVRTDLDGDGYTETCTVTVPVTTTDTNEIRAYYANESGADAWEIRPIKVSISGGFATITFKAWQIPIKGALDDLNAVALDADLAGSYETVVDAYRVYNFEYPQVQMLWESYPNCCGSCTACQLGTQDGCFHLRDPRLGILVPAPATWDARLLTYSSAEWSACREPDQVRLWYYSGFRDNSILRPYADLSPKWEFAVAVFAASKFERAVCGCSNVNQFIEKWRRDGAYSSQNEGGFTMTAEQASNRLGTSQGALYAWRVIHQGDMKVNK
jgi:hypothetical protein